ncbi:hypothetical protein BJ165DRAFT_1534581 [Panaeolus papilionaceus]|nr:hypothetical protein BJ165DRAFT_1534581 [Panaeolus papilionaceus]
MPTQSVDAPLVIYRLDDKPVSITPTRHFTLISAALFIDHDNIIDNEDRTVVSISVGDQEDAIDSILCHLVCNVIEHAYFSVPLEPGHTYTLIRQGACAVDVIACSRMPPDCPTLTAVNKDQRQSSPFEEVAQRSPTKSSARRESRRERRTRASSPTSSSNGATSLKPRNAAQPYRRPEASTSTQKAIAELKIDKKGKAKAAPVKFGYVVAEEGEGPCATFSSRAFVRLFIRNHANPEEVFYTNGESKSALEFLVGDNTVLPEVFSKAVQGMKLNETRRCIIPSDLAFGSSGNPRFGVPSDADLVIDYKLCSLK